MSDLAAPITALKGVGEALSLKLGRLGIERVSDLLFHLPLRYQDRTRLTPIGLLRSGQEAVIEGEVTACDVVKGRRRSLLVRLRDASGPRQVILMATGSEVPLAVEVAEKLEAQGIGADVISMPCWELFEQQGQGYKDDLLPNVPPGEILRVSIEAGSTLGWERYTMANGLNIGLDRFGASGPGDALMDRFGFTAEKIVPQILEKLGN